MNPILTELRRFLLKLLGKRKYLQLTILRRRVFRRLLNIRNNMLSGFLRICGIKKVSFGQYEILNWNAELPAIVFNGFYGITFIGKKKYWNSRIFILDYRSAVINFDQINNITHFNNGFCPVSIFESKILKFGSYEIVKANKKNPVLRLNDSEIVTVLINEKNISPRVLTPFIEGFFHFFIELIPFVLKNMDQFNLVLNFPRNSFYFEILEYFEIPFSEIILPNNLDTTDHFTIAKPNLYPAKEDLEILQSRIFSKEVISKERKRIYITRRNNRNGRIVFEEDYLISKLEEFGFIIIDPDELLFHRQIEIMMTAQIVVSAHGAALSHLVCVPKNCLVIELNGDKDIRWHFEKIASDLNLRYILLMGKTIDKHSFSVDLDRIVNVLNSQ